MPLTVQVETKRLIVLRRSFMNPQILRQQASFGVVMGNGLWATILMWPGLQSIFLEPIKVNKGFSPLTIYDEFYKP